MSNQFLDLDINAKLPIISLKSPPPDSPLPVNGTSDSTNHQQTNGLILKKPSFRKNENYELRQRSQNVSARKKNSVINREHYFHYEEPTQEELLNRVEYDMDELDIAWLEEFNKKNGTHYNYTIPEADFEKIMDRLEKESYFETRKSGGEVLIDEEAVCAICNDDESRDGNAIIFCDMCDLPVHQECYGVPYVPEGQWLCRRCLQSPSKNVSCVLCPNLGGAFKQTDDNRWAHVICALWIPEVCFANTVFLEPIDSISRIPSARWRLNCYICKQKKVGACIQCNKKDCYAPFHVTCAAQAGLFMKINYHEYNTPNGIVKDVLKEAYCDSHSPADREKNGKMYSGDESDDEVADIRVYRKWKKNKKEKMKNAREKLAERREKAFNPIAEPTVQPEKIQEISKLLVFKGSKKKPPKEFEELKNQFIRQIQGYWEMKRKRRNGVPLLRRLQVSYNSSTKTLNGITLAEDLDKDKYTRLRYDLEKARLLVGEVKKREVMKKRLFKLSAEIVEQKFKVIDKDNPPAED